MQIKLHSYLERETMRSLFLLFILLSNFHPQWNAFASPTTSKYDFSYMRAVSDATRLPLRAEYDYIVIGGGTAGCPLAATLSAEHSVLVLERGGVPQEYPEVLRAENVSTTIASDDDGKNPADQFTSGDGVPNTRGRILGGSSMINVGFYSRAEPAFYPKSGLEWDPAQVEEAYRWVEEALVYRPGALLTFQAAFRAAALEAGIVPDNGFTLEHLVGTKLSGLTFDESGRRFGAIELLNRGNLAGNLKVGVRAYVDRILFSSTRGTGLTAIGVTYKDSRGIKHSAYVRPKGEVILSAGAIGSPQLLLLSGVGPASDLSRRLIPVTLPQPNIGKFMADNPRNNVAFVIPFTLGPSLAQIVAITPEFYFESLSFVTPFKAILKPSPLLANLTAPVDLSLAIIAHKVPGPASVEGFLTLGSRDDVAVNPNVRFNYFSDPADLAVCVKGMRKLGEMLSTETLAEYKFDNRNVRDTNGFKYFGPGFPADYRTNDASLERYCRTTITTWWHYHGGCVAGKVVDGDFRFIGINALRVVDGSVFTMSPGTNPQATVLMMGRYAGLKILEQRTA